MAVTFREIRQGELDAALAYAQTLGRTLSRSCIVPSLSLLALGRSGATLGCVLHYHDEAGRPTLAVDLEPAVHPGLGRLLIDRALRKARSTGLSITRVDVGGEAAAALTWSSADWLGRLASTA